MIKLSWCLKNINGIENAKRNCIESIQEDHILFKKQLENSAFSQLKNAKYYSAYFIPEFVDAGDLSHWIKDWCLLDTNLPNQLRKEMATHITKLENCKSNISSQLDLIQKEVERIKLHTTRSMIWGIIFAIVGFLLLYNQSLEYWGIIPLAFGLYKTISAVYRKTEVTTNIEKIDKMMDKFENNYYAGYQPVAYNIHNLIVSNLHYFYPTSGASYPSNKPQSYNSVQQRINVLTASIGIETDGGVFTKLIQKHTPLPAKKSLMFSTASNGQTSVEVHVVEGENELAKYNKTIGRFRVTDIMPAPKGVPKIELIFSVDINGKLNVSAKDLATGHEKAVSISI